MNTKILINRPILGDCREVLRRVPPACVDLVLTDPPFNISSDIRINRGGEGVKFQGKNVSHDFGEWDRFESWREFWIFTKTWVEQCVEVLRPGGIFASYFDQDKINFLSCLLQKRFGFKMRNYCADCKTNPIPQARKVKWMNGWEELGIWQKPGGTLTYNYQLGQHKDYFLRSVVRGKQRFDHPTQKPLEVLRDIIKWWTDIGDLVLDPFCGTGTTLVATLELGRNCIAIDNNPKYVEIADQRIAQTSLWKPEAEDG